MSTENWPTKAQAAQLARMSVRTIERHIQSGKLEARRNEAGSVIVNPDDLGDLLPAAMPAVTATSATHVATQAPGLSMSALLELLNAMAGQLRQPTAERKHEALFLTLEQASEFTGLSPRYLLEQIKSGQLPAIRDGRAWKVKRADLVKL